MLRETIFSPDRKYRYVLWREWECMFVNNNYVVFIGLNPSTADEAVDDPTIRRCVGFAKSWGYGALCMMNLFAYRETHPIHLKASDDPVGQDNDHYLKEISGEASIVIAAWGNHGVHWGRSTKVIDLIPTLFCLKRTANGSPAHPLYLPKTLKPIPYMTREVHQ